MKPAANHVAAALHKILQHVKESEDESLFGLLCLIEQRVRMRVRKKVKPRIAKHAAVKPGNQRPPATPKLTRYVE